jgi:hypothetical protein
MLFNLGYQISDIIWLSNVKNAEDNFWYKNGFVGGDFYGRIFYRNLFNSRVK